MQDLYTAARALYNEAFPGEPESFVDALFALGYPQYLFTECEQGELASMLFALPYAIVTEAGERDARYLYAVATAKKFRGKGHARRLLARVAAMGTPVFLRPMSPSLFDFYKSAGFTPFSAHSECRGDAAGEIDGITHLDERAYLAVRDTLAPLPYCRPTPSYLALSFAFGGAVCKAGEFAALYEIDGDTVLFKEWWGDTKSIPRVAKFLGAAHYCARYPDKNGAPFGMGVGIPDGCRFLAALD